VIAGAKSFLSEIIDKSLLYDTIANEEKSSRPVGKADNPQHSPECPGYMPSRGCMRRGGHQNKREVVSVAKLTDKQKRFVDEYMVDLNATAAARRAGYKDPNIGRQLITKNNVSAEIQKHQAKLRGRLEITQDRVVTELARIAFADRGAFARVTDDGSRVTLTDTDRLTEDQRAALAGVKETKYGIEVSTYDKVRALELLGKHLGMFDAQSTRNLQQENNLLEAIQAQEVKVDAIPELE